MILGTAMIGATASYAMHGTGHKGDSRQRLCQKQQLNDATCQEVKSIIQSYRNQMVPLKKEARIVMQQLNGKIATPGSSWQEVSSLSTQLTSIQTKVFSLKTKARYDVFQKTGVLLPMKKPGFGHKGGKMHKLRMPNKA